MGIKWNRILDFYGVLTCIYDLFCRNINLEYLLQGVPPGLYHFWKEFTFIGFYCLCKFQLQFHFGLGGLFNLWNYMKYWEDKNVFISKSTARQTGTHGSFLGLCQFVFLALCKDKQHMQSQFVRQRDELLCDIEHYVHQSSRQTGRQLDRQTQTNTHNISFFLFTSSGGNYPDENLYRFPES